MSKRRPQGRGFPAMSTAGAPSAVPPSKQGVPGSGRKSGSVRMKSGRLNWSGPSTVTKHVKSSSPPPLKPSNPHGKENTGIGPSLTSNDSKLQFKRTGNDFPSARLYCTVQLVRVEEESLQ